MSSQVKRLTNTWIALSKSGRSTRSIAQEYRLSEWSIRTGFRNAGFIPDPWIMPKLTPENCAWIAAVIDCEGMLTVHTPVNKYRGGRNLQVYARVQMTVQSVPDRLKELCGGTLGAMRRRSPNDANQPSCYWNLASNGLRWLLPQILPYLLVKRRHAEIIIRILATNRRGRRDRMSFTELEPLLREIRFLNQRGKKSDISKHIPRASELNLVEVPNAH